MTGILSMLIGQIYGGSTPVITDPYFDYTTLLLPGNGTNGAQNNTFLDSSTNNFTITRNGNTTQGTFSPFSQTGWGNYFGTSGHALGVSNGLIQTTDTTFTMECWVYMLSNPTGGNPNTFPVLIGQMDQTAGTIRLALGPDGNGKLNFYWYDGSNKNVISTTTIQLNTWTHIAVSVNSNAITLYINGTSSGTGTLTNRNSLQNTFYIGNHYTTVYNYVGYVSQVRVVSGVAVYTGNFTPPTSLLTATQSSGTNISAITTGQTKLLTCQSNRFVDNGQGNTSNTPFAITVAGSPSVVAFSPFNPSASWSAATYGGSGYFDGNGDYLQGPVNSAFAFGTGEYCMEGWIYMTSAPASPSGLIDLRRAAPNYNAPWLNVTSGYKLALRDGTLGVDVVTGATNIQLNTWTHVAVTRQVTSNAGTRIFLNGVLDANSITNNSNYSNGALTLATAGDSLGNYMFTGYMSDVRITKGSVPTSYQTSATTSGTVVFTPPTSPETTTSQGASSPSILLNFTNAGIYDATSKNDLETVGNAQISTTQSKWGGSSMSFNGSSNTYLSIPSYNPDLMAFGSGDFTIEFWLYLNSTSTIGVPYDGRPSGTGTASVPLLYIQSAVIKYLVSGADRITGSTLSTGQWYHIALARSSGSTKLFINGTQSGSTYSDSTVYVNSSGRPLIGGDGNTLGQNLLNGYMQDLRVTKGVARYTANFTAPTAAFPTL